MVRVAAAQCLHGLQQLHCPMTPLLMQTQPYRDICRGLCRVLTFGRGGRVEGQHGPSSLQTFFFFFCRGLPSLDQTYSRALSVRGFFFFCAAQSTVHPPDHRLEDLGTFSFLPTRQVKFNWIEIQKK